MKTLIPVCLLCACMGAACAATQVYEPASPEPTAEEALLLEYINRLRVNPTTEAARLTPEDKETAMRVFGDIDWEMFAKEMASLKPVPPLVFDLDLLASARRHSHYMILHDICHDEDSDKSGYTGKNFTARCKSAGYAGFACAENVYRDADGPRNCHIGFVVDFGKGPGGMQKGRGHRANLMLWSAKEIGPGAVPHGNGLLSVTHNFGERDVPRRVGGVVYVDINGNGFYDPGEGLGGIKITASDGSGCRTWAAGAYAFDLKSADRVTLTAEFDGATHSVTEKPGASNIKFDWAVPADVVNGKIDRLLAEAQQNKDSPKALVALHLGACELKLDADRTQRIEGLTGKIKVELLAHQQAVLAALKTSDRDGTLACISEHQKPYAATPAVAWFEEAGQVAQARQSVAELERQVKVRRQRSQRLLLQQLENTRGQLTFGALREQIAEMMAQVKRMGD